MSRDAVKKINKSGMLGSILLELKLITPEKLEIALKEQSSLNKTGHRRLGDVLVGLGFISEDEMLGALSSQLGLEYLKFSEYPKTIPNIPYPTIKFMKQYKFVPIGAEDKVLKVAVSDPLNEYVIDTLQFFSNKSVEIFLSSENDIMEAIEQYFGSNVQMTSIMEGMREEENETVDIDELQEDVHHLRDMAFEAPIVKLVNMLITRAVEGRTSDIHIEPFENSVKVRYRIDGALMQVESLPKRIQPAVISRIKIMSRLNIAERRLPQDGRIRLRVSGRDIDLRVSSIPTIYGESIVMRILDRGTALIVLDYIGFPDELLDTYKKLITTPYGMLLVTGPTGSGKTTTLYASLNKINSDDKKIITVEDPIEYQIDGINQIPIKPQIGLTFANGLRHIVRQDPDVIMVGEIRDIETAEIAIHSALTGHLVFSTLHTNDAPGTISRLLNMGIEPFLVAASTVLIASQRLVRKICPQCKEEEKIPVPALIKLGFSEEEAVSVKCLRGKGCPACNNAGYRGRIGLYEIMPMKDEIKELTLEGASSDEIKKAAVRLGMRTLRISGLTKIKDGTTSVEEIVRATFGD